jgi:mannose-6-phosphate isomerase-like protein (cupin superfamily)
MNDPDWGAGGAHYALARALQSASKPNAETTEILRGADIDLEFYSPRLTDLQQPHDRHELYAIARGTGVLVIEGDRFPFTSGDVLYVPAHARHRFEEFSEDFATWVIFYGPVMAATHER